MLKSASRGIQRACTGNFVFRAFAAVGGGRPARIRGAPRSPIPRPPRPPRAEQASLAKGKPQPPVNEELEADIMKEAIQGLDLKWLERAALHMRNRVSSSFYHFVVTRQIAQVTNLDFDNPNNVLIGMRFEEILTQHNQDDNTTLTYRLQKAFDDIHLSSSDLDFIVHLALTARSCRNQAKWKGYWSRALSRVSELLKSGSGPLGVATVRGFVELQMLGNGLSLKDYPQLVRRVLTPESAAALGAKGLLEMYVAVAELADGAGDLDRWRMRMADLLCLVPLDPKTLPTPLLWAALSLTFGRQTHRLLEPFQTEARARPYMQTSGLRAAHGHGAIVRALAQLGHLQVADDRPKRPDAQDRDGLLAHVHALVELVQCAALQAHAPIKLVAALFSAFENALVLATENK
jgi:hypothetical protein